MTRAEMELLSLKTTIISYQKMLNNSTLTSDEIKNIKLKIKELENIRNNLLNETNNYGL